MGNPIKTDTLLYSCFVTSGPSDSLKYIMEKSYINGNILIRSSFLYQFTKVTRRDLRSIILKDKLEELELFSTYSSL